MAVDRKVFADTVFLGAGVPVFGAETPANKKWYWTGIPADAARPGGAHAVLASIGLTDRNGDGTLEDAAQPAGALHAADAAGPAEPRARRGGHPRRAEEDRPDRGRRGARRRRRVIDRFLNAQIRRGVLQRRQDRSRSRRSIPTSGSAPAARTLEPRAEDAGDRLGAAHRRADGAADRVARRERAKAPLRRGAEDLLASTCRSSISSRRGSTRPTPPASSISRRPSRVRSCCGGRTWSRSSTSC